MICLVDSARAGISAAEFLSSWSFPRGPLVALPAAGVLYFRGWRVTHRLRPRQLPLWRALSFFAGLLTLWIAIASPLDALDDFLLAAHMVQHFLLMSMAPPLILLGAPAVPLLRGIPRAWIRRASAPVFRAPWFHALRRLAGEPVVAWMAMNVAYLAWHVPAAFEITFRSERIHNLEHLCFFFTSVAFWWVVIAPWPSHPRWPRWAVLPYLLSADVVNTILSATLTFSGRVLYPAYALAPRITRLTALQDQAAAGAEMWVLNSVVFLIPAVIVTVQLLSPRDSARVPQRRALQADGAPVQVK